LETFRNRKSDADYLKQDAIIGVAWGGLGGYAPLTFRAYSYFVP